MENYATNICISRKKWRGAGRQAFIMIVQSRPLPVNSIHTVGMIAALLTDKN
jgi:hypothetical protein